MNRIPNLDDLITVEDHRTSPRFTACRPLSGEIMGEPASVRDLSVSGLGLTHVIHVRPGSPTHLSLRDTEFGEVVHLNTRVMWSHLSGDRNEAGALLYSSGVRIEDDVDRIGGKIGRLLRYYGTPETESLEKKRLNALSLLMKRVTAERKLLLELEPGELMLSYHALSEISRLEAAEIADLSRGAAESLAATGRPSAWNREVLAAWKSLDGSIELPTLEAARKILAEIDQFVREHQ